MPEGRRAQPGSLLAQEKEPDKKELILYLQ